MSISLLATIVLAASLVGVAAQSATGEIAGVVNGKRFDDNLGAAAFGHVVAGLDVVRKIQQQPVQGQNLTPPIAILKAYRISPPKWP